MSMSLWLSMRGLRHGIAALSSVMAGGVSTVCGEGKCGASFGTITSLRTLRRRESVVMSGRSPAAMRRLSQGRQRCAARCTSRKYCGASASTETFATPLGALSQKCQSPAGSRSNSFARGSLFFRHLGVIVHSGSQLEHCEVHDLNSVRQP